jgi:hypothetical protein
VISFTPRLLYPRYPLDRRLRGPQNRSGRCGEEKILDRTGTRTPTPRSSSPQLVAIPAPQEIPCFYETRRLITMFRRAHHLALSCDQLNSSVGTLRARRPGNRGSIPDRDKRFFFFLQRPDRLWDPPSRHRGLFLWELKRAELEADHSPPSSAEFKNGCAIPPPPVFMALCLVN